MSPADIFMRFSKCFSTLKDHMHSVNHEIREDNVDNIFLNIIYMFVDILSMGLHYIVVILWNVVLYPIHSDCMQLTEC